MMWVLILVTLGGDLEPKRVYTMPGECDGMAALFVAEKGSKYAGYICSPVAGDYITRKEMFARAKAENDAMAERARKMGPPPVEMPAPDQ